MKSRSNRTVTQLICITLMLPIVVAFQISRLLVMLAGFIWVGMFKESRDAGRASATVLGIEHVDLMAPVEFELYVARLMAVQGFTGIAMTPASGDLGVDIVAQRNGCRYAIQVKRYSRPVPRTAVSDVVGGMVAYGCSKAMVVTNNYFSCGARKLAQLNGCVAVDRHTLSRWISDSQVEHKLDSGKWQPKWIVGPPLQWSASSTIVLLCGPAFFVSFLAVCALT